MKRSLLAVLFLGTSGYVPVAQAVPAQAPPLPVIRLPLPLPRPGERPKPNAVPAVTAHMASLTGHVLDSRGHPLPNARVTVRGGSNGASLQTLTDEHGFYTVPTGEGRFEVAATIPVVYDGQALALPLCPLDHMSDAAVKTTGGVKNFIWHLTGLKPGAGPATPNSYYGGTLRLSVPEGAQRATTNEEVRVLLTPLGRLIDGTTGFPLHRDLPGNGQSEIWEDIPLGRYDAQVFRLGPGRVMAPSPILRAVIDFRPTSGGDFAADLTAGQQKTDRG